MSAMTVAKLRSPWFRLTVSIRRSAMLSAVVFIAASFALPQRDSAFDPLMTGQSVEDLDLMLLILPPIGEVSTAFARGLAIADERILARFDATVEELRAENQFVPNDVLEIRDRLIAHKIGPVEAHWLLLAPDDRPKLDTFQEMVSTRLAAARK